MSTSRIARFTRRLLVGLLVLLLAVVALVWGLLRASLPQLDGNIQLSGLRAPLSISRDSLGTAVLQGSDRQDLARGLGYVHAQERYFEMDLTRRSAAGELSALFGAVALERDKSRRVHRMRARLQARLAQLAPAEQALLSAYAEGVNAGLQALRVRPWQYLLLRAEPARWTEVDSLLVVSEMYFMLQAGGFDAGFERALLRERSGDALFDWLNPRGGPWDAALDGSQLPAAPLPSAAQLDLRQRSATLLQRGERSAALHPTISDEAPVPGSNNWAVAGSRSRHGGAILADDMHLGLGVPSIWYRAQFQLGEGAQALRAAGVTLPGMPSLVVGSNGSVAWGFTNAYGQWFDWIKLPAAVAPERLKVVQERIEVKGGSPVSLEVSEFDGVPVVREQGGQRYALRWIAQQGEAYNLEFDRLLGAKTLDEAIGSVQRAGLPHQNVLIADREGHIAWTIAGRLWQPGGMAQHYGRFQGADLPAPAWLAPQDYPLLRDPADGQLWTANNRQLGGEKAELVGDGGFDLGARAQQIRDRLREIALHDEDSLNAIHFDNEARFVQRWAARVADTVKGSPAHAEVAAQLQAWNGRADADQVGYRLARAVRLKTLDALWAAWTEPLLGADQNDEKKRIKWRAQFEYSATQALDAQPPHLLPKGHASWQAFQLAQVDAAVRELTRDGQQTLAQATWGQHNASRIQHPLARAIPALSWLLDMPSQPQGGDSNLPHVAQPAFGQSERMVVSPGREAQASLSMPGGQSGHPLSPFYGAGHAAWVAGHATPLLAGPAQHQLSAAPSR